MPKWDTGEGRKARESLDRKYVPHFYVRQERTEEGRTDDDDVCGGGVGSFLNLFTLFWAPEMVNGGGGGATKKATYKRSD